MLLSPTPAAAGPVWSFDRGEASWEPRSGRWRRPGLDGALVVHGDGVTLSPTLEEEPIVAHLVTPVTLPPLGRTSLTLAWPLALIAQVDGRPFDRFRPGARATLLGDMVEGRLLAAVRADEVRGPLPPWKAALQVTLRNEVGTPQVVRRVAFEERALTLWVDEGALHAGAVDVRIVDEHAEATVVRPSMVTQARVLRPGLEGRSSALLGWVDGSRRSMGFSL